MTLLRIAFVNEERDELTAADEVERGAIGDALRRGICPTDRAFDRFLPTGLRRVSRQYWTPLAAALRAAEWLDVTGARTVVDIGSGAGKFCVAAALAGRCSFIGVEHRPHLVDAARRLARTFGVDDRVRFVQRTLDEDDLPQADCYYLYNPYGENLLPPEEHLDAQVELSDERFERDVASTEAALDRAPVGTYVIKYNGFGGNLPPEYDQILIDRNLPNVLRMCRKNRSQ